MSSDEEPFHIPIMVVVSRCALRLPHAGFEKVIWADLDCGRVGSAAERAVQAGVLTPGSALWVKPGRGGGARAVASLRRNFGL